MKLGNPKAGIGDYPVSLPMYRLKLRTVDACAPVQMTYSNGNRGGMSRTGAILTPESLRIESLANRGRPCTSDLYRLDGTVRDQLRGGSVDIDDGLPVAHIAFE